MEGWAKIPAAVCANLIKNYRKHIYKTRSFVRTTCVKYIVHATKCQLGAVVAQSVGYWLTGGGFLV